VTHATPTTPADAAPRAARRHRDLRILRVALVALLAATAMGAGASQAAGAAEGSDEAEVAAFVAEVEASLPEQMARDGVPGAAVALVVDGAVVWEAGFGRTELEGGRPVTPRTRFPAASMSKPLAAWAVARLVEDGEVALDDPLTAHVDRWVPPLPPEQRAHVTVERLLAHTAGLPWRYEGEPDWTAPPPPDRRLAGTGGTEAVRFAQAPGEGFRYANPGFDALELLVEERSGRPFPAFMAEEVLAPLDMGDSTFDWHEAADKDVVPGHTLEGSLVRFVDEPGPSPAAAGLVTTAADYARFLAASTGRGPTAAGAGVLTPETAAGLHTPRTPTAGLPHVLMADHAALGHFVDTLEDGRRGIGHGGEQGGWLAGSYLVPETGDGFVLLMNSRRGYRLMFEQLASWTAWGQLGEPTMSATFSTVLTGVQVATAATATMALALALRLGADLRAGRRLRPRGAGRWTARLGDAAFALALLALWWALARGIVVTFLPGLAGWLAASLHALVGVLLLAALLPRRTRIPAAAREEPPAA